MTTVTILGLLAVVGALTILSIFRDNFPRDRK